MDLSIVIVNFNTEKLLAQCLDSIYASAPDLKLEIIVVDNASSGFQAFPKVYPGIKVIRNRANLGFARANNQGLNEACGDFVLFLNPDTEVTKGSLEKMIGYIRNNPGIGILGPKLVYPDGSLQLSCRRFYTLRAIILSRIPVFKLVFGSKARDEHLMADWGHDRVKDVDWVLGACILASRSELLELGGFDQAYRLYFEDVDLCYRMKNKGLRIIYYPDSVIIHHHRRESAKLFSRKAFPHIAGALRFFRKYGWSF